MLVSVTSAGAHPGGGQLRTVWLEPAGSLPSHGRATIYVTVGVGRVQRRGGAVEAFRPGDRLFFEPAETHWRGAALTRFMTHLSIVGVDDSGRSPTWGNHVSDEHDGAATRIDS